MIPAATARAGKLEQITKDHSLLQEQIDAGLISPEQAANSSIKNLVTRALGVEDTVLLEVNEHDIAQGDLYCCVQTACPTWWKTLQSLELLRQIRVWSKRPTSWSMQPMKTGAEIIFRC